MINKIISFLIGGITIVILAFFKGRKSKESEQNQNTLNDVKDSQTIRNNVSNMSRADIDKQLSKYTRKK